MATRYYRAKGRTNFEAGRSAECIVRTQLEREGYHVAEARWKGDYGEIDLILADADGFVFVEVKKARSFDEAAHRLGPRQVRRILTSALDYVSQSSLGLNATMRFDLAVVNAIGECEIHQNAFGEA